MMHGGEGRCHLRAAAALLAFELVVNLVRALGDQKEAADDENQVTAGNRLAERGEDRGGQAHHPRNRQQQADADEHRQRQAQLARPLALLLPQLPGQDGDEHDVVDAEDDFKDGQRAERDPSFGAGDPVERAQQ